DEMPCPRDAVRVHRVRSHRAILPGYRANTPYPPTRFAEAACRAAPGAAGLFGRGRWPAQPTGAAADLAGAPAAEVPAAGIPAAGIPAAGIPAAGALVASGAAVTRRSRRGSSSGVASMSSPATAIPVRGLVR